MKKLLLLCMLSIAILSFKGKDRLIGKKMPSIKGTTIRGTKVDSTFFKGKVTLVDFMYIGCSPCMQEVKDFVKINNDLKGTNFQILIVAPNSAEHIKIFNTSIKNDSPFYELKAYYKLDSIQYEMLPECSKGIEPKVDKNGDTHVGPECNTIGKFYGVEGYPKSVLINEKGIIVKIYDGYSDGMDKELLADIKPLVKKQ